MLDYLLMFFVILAHYSLGRGVKVNGVITGSLVGISLSAIFVGILANYSAGLIPAYIKYSVLILSIPSVYLFVKSENIKVNASNAKVSVLLLVALILFVYVNQPESVFLINNESGVFLSFNPHYSYLSSQSLEMLLADYPSRLKIVNQYPNEWAAYHFFSGGLFAILRNFSSHRYDLFAYFDVQLILTCFAFLSCAETFLNVTKINISNAISYILWVVTGISLFYPSISWLAYSNSIISLWAVITLVWLSSTKNIRMMLVVTLILCASSARMIPVCGFLAFIMYYQLHKNNLLKNDYSLHAVAGLVAAYIIATFSVPKADFATFFSGAIVNPVWHTLLFSYRVIGFVLSFFGFSPLARYEWGGDYLSFFSRVPLDTIRGKLFVFTLFAIIVYILFDLLKIKASVIRNACRKINKIAVYMAIFSVGVLVVAFFVHRPAVKSFFQYIFILVIPYLLLNLWLLEKIDHSAKKGVASWAGLLFVVFTAYQVTGANEIKGPVSYLAFDVITWALIGLAFFKRLFNRGVFNVFFCLFLIFIAFPPRLSGLHKMDISPLIDINIAKNGLIVDEPANRLTAKSCGALENIECDAASAYNGWRITGDNKTSNFITREFILKNK